MTIERLRFLFNVWQQDKEPDAIEEFREGIETLWPQIEAVLTSAVIAVDTPKDSIAGNDAMRRLYVRLQDLGAISTERTEK